MDQLAEMKTVFGKGCAALLGVMAAVVVLGTGGAKAADLKSGAALGVGVQVAMLGERARESDLGEPVRDGDLRDNRGTGLDTPAPDASVQPSGGHAVILWDEPGQGPAAWSSRKVRGRGVLLHCSMPLGERLDPYAALSERPAKRPAIPQDRGQLWLTAIQCRNALLT